MNSETLNKVVENITGIEDETIILEKFGFNESDEVKIKELIQEALSQIHPIPQLRSRTARRRLLEECGEKAFINPDRLEYPVINPQTCDYDCRLLNRAYYELCTKSVPGALDMKHKVKSIMENNGCKINVLVKVDEDTIIDLDHLMFILS